MSNRILPPDHNNYYAFGRAWKDRTNGVTELSEQVGSGHVDLSQDEAARHAHQTQFLQARLNTLLDTISTPIVAGKAPVGGINLAYVRQPLSAFRNAPVLPSISRGRPPSMKSFDEHKAAAKLIEEYSRCDWDVRKKFLEEVVAKADDAQDQRIRNKLLELSDDLQEMPEGRLQNLGELRKQEALLKQMRTSVESKQGLDKFGARAKQFFQKNSLEKLKRKIDSIESPSSYAVHRAANGGDKVSNTPLYVKELRNRNRGTSNDEAPLQTGRDIRNFTARAFDNLAGAIRRFQDLSQRGLHPDAMRQATQTLRNAAKPLLYSKERNAVHRFIRDMMRQLKRAGVPADDLKELNDLIPDEPGSFRKVFQSVVPGTGKQMGLQDEAERMAKALPQVLELASTYREQLKNNLMQFDLHGVTSLRDTLVRMQASGIDVVNASALTFVKSSQGKAFVDAMIAAMEQDYGQNHPHLKEHIDNLKNKETRKDPFKTIYALSAALSSAGADISDVSHIYDITERTTKKTQHLFMVTSDSEFWEKEAVGKLGTSLTESNNPEEKTRLYKQMTLRAAAMKMAPGEVDAFMKQGIENTLRNRRMSIEGTKVGSAAFSIAGNILSTPISVPLAASPKTAFLAGPILLDAGLMTIGWGLGLAPGAMYGATVLERRKQARLKETEDRQDAVEVSLSGSSASPNLNATYTSASKTLKIGKASVQMRIHIGGVQKRTQTAMHISGKTQFTRAHGTLLKGMGGELASVAYDPARYALYQGPKDAWTDLVRRNDPKQAARLRAGPPSPAFVNAAPENGSYRSSYPASPAPSQASWNSMDTPRYSYRSPRQSHQSYAQHWPASPQQQVVSGYRAPYNSLSYYGNI